MGMKAVVNRGAYTDRESAMVGAETKTVANLERALARATKCGSKAEMAHLKTALKEAKSRLADYEADLAKSKA